MDQFQIINLYTKENKLPKEIIELIKNYYESWENVTLYKTLEGHTNPVTSVAINEKYIVSGCIDKTIKIWNIETGKCLKTLKGHTHWVESVAINEKYIVSGSDDKTIKIWVKN